MQEYPVFATHGDGKPNRKDIAEALGKIIEKCDWKGVVGVGLPGIVRTTPEEPSFASGPYSSLADSTVRRARRSFA